MKEKIVVIIFLCILFSAGLSAQNKYKSERNSDIIEYRSKDGLPSNNFQDAVQTKDGYIWLSGTEGTFRFDGNEFAYIGKEFGIPEMQSIFYDSTKNILYFASPEKFATFDGSNFKSYGYKSGYKLNENSGQVISFVKADSKGTIWIGSFTPFTDKKFNGCLLNFKDNKFTVFDSLSFPLDNAQNFIETPFGDLIFSSFGRNTQNGDGAYIALYKNNIFTRIDEKLGVNYYNAILQDEHTSYIDFKGNTWIPFSGNLDFETENKNKGSGVLVYDGENFKSFPGLEKYITQGIYVGSVFCDNDKKKIYVNLDKMLSTKITANENLIFELGNNIWEPSTIYKQIFAEAESGANDMLNFVYNFSRFQKSSRHFPFSLIFGSIAAAQFGPIGIYKSAGDPSQYFVFKNNRWSKYDAFNGRPILNLDNGLMLSTAKGIGFLSPSNSLLLKKADGLLFPESTLPNLTTDKRGIVWITSSYSFIPSYISLSNSGLNVWDGKSLRIITEKDGLKSNITFDPYHDSNMRLWIPTDKGVTQIREIQNGNGEWIFKLKNIDLKTDKPYNASNVIETKKKEIFVYQNYVRPQYSSITKANFFLGKMIDNNIVEIKSPFNDKLQSQPYQLYFMREAANGMLWLEGQFASSIEKLSSVKTEIKLFNGKEWLDPPTEWNVPEQQLHFVGELENGAYYLTAGHFYNFNGNKFIDISDSSNQFADFRILKGASVTGTLTNIQVGKYLYIRLRNRGLVIFDGKNLNYYTPRNSAIPTDIHNPVTNYFGDVFFGSHAGAVKLHNENVELYYDDEAIGTGGPEAAAVDLNGNIIKFFTGIGLSIEMHRKEFAPLKISSININDDPYYYLYPSTLSYSENSILFNYSVLNYSRPDQTLYEHILKGYDKEWSRSSNISFSEYQNLPPGDYIFKVRATVSNGEKTNESFYAFAISPPFWKTWWAYSIYFLMFGGFLFSIRKIELKRQTKNAAINESLLRAEAAELKAKAAEAQSRIIQAENERKTSEMEEARELQLSMLPKELPKVENLEIAVYMKTATEVGGDYYDFSTKNDNSLNIAIGDATGHGMKAGTLVSMMKSIFTVESSKLEIEDFFLSANNGLKKMSLNKMMMAFAMVNICDDKIKIANAGIPPIFIYRANKNIVEEVNLNGLPLGAMKNSKYDIYESELLKGDTLLMLSDGLPELQSNKKEMYGYERLKKVFTKNGKKSTEDIILVLKEEGSNWVNDKDPDDDVTFIVIKIQ